MVYALIIIAGGGAYTGFQYNTDLRYAYKESCEAAKVEVIANGLKAFCVPIDVRYSK